MIRKARTSIICAAVAAIMLPAALVASLPATALAAAGPAHARTSDQGRLSQAAPFFQGYFIDNQTGRCLESYYGALSTKVCRQYGQLWYTYYSEIQDIFGNCLDSNYSGSAYLLACNGGNYQNWKYYYVGNGLYNIIDQQTGRCLDSNNSGSVYTSPCNGGNYQNWWPTTSI